MKNAWKDSNMLLREGRSMYQGHETEEFYKKVTFTYRSEEDRDKAFDYFSDDETRIYNMAIPHKKGDKQIELSKYYVIVYDSPDNEDINQWAEEEAAETGAVGVPRISESSYEEYHDFIDLLDSDK